jgi:hypothetical protein
MNEVIIVIITIALVLYNIERIIDLIAIVLKKLFELTIFGFSVVYLLGGIPLILFLILLIFE